MANPYTQYVDAANPAGKVADNVSEMPSAPPVAAAPEEHNGNPYRQFAQQAGQERIDYSYLFAPSAEEQAAANKPDSLADVVVKSGKAGIQRMGAQVGGMRQRAGESGFQGALELNPDLAGQLTRQVQLTPEEIAKLPKSDGMELPSPETLRKAREDKARKALQAIEAEAPEVKAGREMYQRYEQRAAEARPKVEPGSFKYYLGAATETFVGNVVPMMATALITRSPNVALGLMGGQVYGEKYAEQRATGRTPEQANIDALFYAASEAITEKIPLSVVLKRGSPYLKKVLEGTVAEGGQEVFNEALQIGYDKGVLKQDIDLKTALRRMLDSGIVGGMVGGGMATVAAPFTAGEQPAQQPDTPSPEAQSTINAQLASFMDGRKRAVLFTPGEAIPEELPPGSTVEKLENGKGTLLYRQDDPDALELANVGKLGDVLTYGIDAKPAASDIVVTARDAQGRVVQEVVTDGRKSVIDAARKVAGEGGSVQVRTTAQAMAERQAERQEEVRQDAKIRRRRQVRRLTKQFTRGQIDYKAYVSSMQSLYATQPFPVERPFEDMPDGEVTAPIPGIDFPATRERMDHRMPGDAVLRSAPSPESHQGGPADTRGNYPPHPADTRGKADQIVALPDGVLPTDILTSKQRTFKSKSAAVAAISRHSLSGYEPVKVKSGFVLRPSEIRDAQPERSDAGRVAEHGGAMPQPGEQELPAVRGQGNNGMPSMEGELSGVSGRHGSAPVETSYAGTDGQRPGIQPEQLPVGDQAGAKPQSANQSMGRVPRAETDTAGLGEGTGNQRGNIARTPAKVAEGEGADAQGAGSRSKGRDEGESSRERNQPGGAGPGNRAAAESYQEQGRARKDGRRTGEAVESSEAAASRRKAENYQGVGAGEGRQPDNSEGQVAARNAAGGGAESVKGTEDFGVFVQTIDEIAQEEGASPFAEALAINIARAIHVHGMTEDKVEAILEKAAVEAGDSGDYFEIGVRALNDAAKSETKTPEPVPAGDEAVPQGRPAPAAAPAEQEQPVAQNSPTATPGTDNTQPRPAQAPSMPEQPDRKSGGRTPAKASTETPPEGGVSASGAEEADPIKAAAAKMGTRDKTINYLRGRFGKAKLAELMPRIDALFPAEKPAPEANAPKKDESPGTDPIDPGAEEFVHGGYKADKWAKKFLKTISGAQPESSAGAGWLMGWYYGTHGIEGDPRIHPSQVRAFLSGSSWGETWQEAANRLGSDQKAYDEVIQDAPAKNMVGEPIDKPARTLDQAAHEAATSPRNDLPEPTDAQKEAGNYTKGHITLHGLEVSIENPAGSKRRPEWPTLKHHYGYFTGTEGKDGDHVDVFLGPDTENPKRRVFVIDQVDPKTGAFDEHKVMMGFDGWAAARQGYLRNYEKGWKGLGGYKSMKLDEFKDWLKGDTTKPVSDKVANKSPKVAKPEAVPSNPETPAKKIEDLGEKIGGARKDTSRPLGKRTIRETKKVPAWRKRFVAMEEMTTGKWHILDTRTGKALRGSGFTRLEFDTADEADAFVPMAAVGLKHRVVSDGDKYKIVRDVTDRKRITVVQQRFDTRDDAMKYMAEHAEEILETKTSFGEEVLPTPETVYRTGAARRTGDVTGDDFMSTFGFRGVEFGNWNNQAERQEVMNHAYDALLDMTDVLKVPPKALALNGDLGLAFGARGQGLSGAKAHYETNYGVINLTKMSGAGSLGHEWFHALDHYLSRQDNTSPAERTKDKSGNLVYEKGDFASEVRTYKPGLRKELRDAYDALITTMFKKGEQYVEDTRKADDFVARARDALQKELDRIRADLAEQKDPKYWKRNNKPASAEQLAAFDALSATLVDGQDLDTEFRYNKPGDTPARNRGALAGRRSNDTLDGLSAVYKAVRGRTGFSSDGKGLFDGMRHLMRNYAQRIQMLEDAKSETTKVKQVPTSFAMEAKEADQGRASNYWTTPHEMAARAFAAYLEDRIGDQGAQSQFLTYHAHGAVIAPTEKGYFYPYPQGEERKAINQAFDGLVGTLKTRETENGTALFSRKLQDKVAPRSLPIPTEAAKPISTTTHPELLKEHPKRDAAKGGDPIAAADLVSDFVSEESLAEAAERFGADTLFLPVIAEEKSGENRLPLATAYLYANHVGGKVVDDQVIQVSRAHHTGKGPMARLVSRPLFDGPVQVGGKYVLVDDVTVMGGTLAELASYIQGHGGEVVGIVTLVNASRSGTLAATSAQSRKIEGRFGDEIRSLFGVEPAGLTGEEATYILGFRDADALRARAAKESLQGSREGGPAAPEGETEPVLKRASPEQQKARPSAGLPVSEVRAAILPRWRAMANKVSVEVVESVADLPDAIQRQMQAKGVESVEGVAYQGRIYLVADQISSPERAQVVLFDHELRHVGLRGMFGKAVNPFLNQVWMGREHTKVKAFAEKHKIDTSTLNGKKEAAEEYIVHLAETGQTNNWLQKLYALLRDLARRLGFDVEFSDVDLRQIVANAGTLMEKGGRVRPDVNRETPVFSPAYHGSPHTFTKFDMEKIGTGEGTQAYGHGLYFAESPGVAKSYQNTTSKPFIDSDFQGGWAVYKPDPTVRGMAGPQRKISESFKTRAEAEQALAKTPDTSALYEVDIPDEAISKMLDYDKPLSEQADSVKAALKAVAVPKSRFFTPEPEHTLRKSVAGMLSGEYRQDITGGELYGLLAKRLGGKKEASQALASVGIPGIRYLDQASRGAGEGTRNFVVFDPSIITVLKRNGDLVDDARFSRRIPGLNATPEQEARTAKATDAVKKWARRNFTKEGLLNKEAFEAKLEKEGMQNVGEADVAALVSDLEDAVTAAFGKQKYNEVDQSDLNKVNAYLAGEDVNLPRGLSQTLDGMRGYLDRLSGNLLQAVQDMMAIDFEKLSERQQEQFQQFLQTGEGDVPAGIAKHFYLYQTISSNLGTYLNRSYQAFDDPNWKEKALADSGLVARAEAFIREQNEDLTDEEVTGAVRAILQNAKKHGNFVGLISQGTKVGSKDVSFLKRRKDVPLVIRQLLGEYKDPKVNFVRSATKMQWYVANHHFLMSLRRSGLGVFLFERPTGQFDDQISSDGSETMNPINGLYTTEEFRQGLEDASNKYNGSQLMRNLIRMNSVVKYNKTILSPTTQFRNFMSAAMFTVMNGHFNWSHMGKSFRAARADLFTHDEQWRGYIKKLVGLGVLHDNPYAGELRDALNDFTQMNVYTKGKLQSAKRFLNFMQRAYQIGDDFWKIIGWENEVSLQRKAGLSQAEAEKAAAFRIRNGYPTYSMVPRAIKHIRRWPLIGTFVSFPYEIVRTSYNQMRFLREDMRAGRTEAVTRRILGMAVATAASAAASAFSMSLMGLSDDDDEAIRAQLPEWSRNSQLFYVGYDENGMPVYMDLSYLDPYTYLKKPITALLNGNNRGLTDKIKDALAEFLDPFIGADIAAGALFEIVANKRMGTGGQVYNPEDSPGRKVADIANHVRQAVQPGAMSNLERTIKAIEGDSSPSGKQYSIKDEGLAWIGFRFGTLNLPQSMIYRAYQFSDAKRSATRIVSQAAGTASNVSDWELRGSVDAMLRAHRKAYEDMINLVNGARKLGMTDARIAQSLRAARVSKGDIQAILAGVVPPWRMSKMFLKSAVDRAMAAARNEQHRHELQRELIRRRELIQRLIEQDSRQVR